MPQDRGQDIGTVINSDGSLHDVHGRGMIRIKLIDLLINEPATFVGTTAQALEHGAQKMRGLDAHGLTVGEYVPIAALRLGDD